MVLGAAAALAVLIGLIMTARSMAGLSRTAELHRRKADDLRTLAAMRHTAQYYRSVAAARDRTEGAVPPLTDLLRSVLSGRDATIRELPPLPTLPGWSARRVSVVLTNLPGEELGRLLQEAGRQQPGWTLLECTLQASPEAGRLTRVELVLGTVEKTIEGLN